MFTALPAAEVTDRTNKTAVFSRGNFEAALRWLRTGERRKAFAMTLAVRSPATSWQRKRNIPIHTEPNNLAPTTPAKKAGPLLIETVAPYAASSAVITPRAAYSASTLAPAG